MVLSAPARSALATATSLVVLGVAPLCHAATIPGEPVQFVRASFDNI